MVSREEKGCDYLCLILKRLGRSYSKKKNRLVLLNMVSLKKRNSPKSRDEKKKPPSNYPRR